MNKKTISKDQLLLSQLIDILFKTHKKMYKLKSELEKDEITTRYIKIDFNNVQVELDDTKLELKNTKNKLVKSLTEI